MQTVDAAHAAAIDATSRTLAASVYVDWLGTGSVVQAYAFLDEDVMLVEVDRSYATALPAGIGFLEGYSVAQLKVQVAGPTAAAVNRFNASSPLATGTRVTAPITASIGVAGFTPVLQFTGVIRTISSDSRFGTATLEGLDSAERFRFTPVVPDVVAVAATGAPSYTNEKKQWLNASWLISEILSQGAIPTGAVHVTPAPLATTQLYASMNGSLAPRAPYGTLYRMPQLPYGGTEPFVAGRTGLALFNTPTVNGLYYQIVYSLGGMSNAASEDNQIEFWALAPYTGGSDWIVELGNGNAIGASSTYVRCTISAAGRMSVVLKRNSQAKSGAALGPVPTTVTAFRYYAVHVAWGTTTAVVTVRTQDTSVATTVTVGAVTGTTAMGYARIGNGAKPAIEGLQISHNTTADFSHSTHIPEALLDPSKLWLDRTPSDLPDTAWGVMTEIAAAEYATIEFDESGQLLYRNADRWAEFIAAQSTVTADHDLLDLAATEDINTVRNRISIPISNVKRRRNGDRTTMGWPDETPVDPGETVTIPLYCTLGFGTVLDARLADGWVVSEAKWTDNAHPWYSTTVTGAGLPNDGQWDVERVEWEGQVIYATVTNTTNGILYLGWSSSMEVVLTPPTRYDAEDAASLSAYGARPYTLPASDWRQQGTGAQALADRVLADLKTPITLLTEVPVVGDMRRQLGDRITIQDPTGLLVDQDYWLIGCRTTLKPGSLTQDLTLRPS